MNECSPVQSFANADSVTGNISSLFDRLLEPVSTYNKLQLIVP